MDIKSGTPPPRPNSRRDNNGRTCSSAWACGRASSVARSKRTGRIWFLTAAGRTGSALRLALKQQGIDPKQARLVLRTLPTIDRPRGVAFGIRQCPTWADVW